MVSRIPNRDFSRSNFRPHFSYQSNVQQSCCRPFNITTQIAILRVAKFSKYMINLKMKVHTTKLCFVLIYEFLSWEKNKNTLTWIKSSFSKKYIFRLFIIISISQKFFTIFFLTLEKIGIDEKVICYHNISN